MGLLRGVVQAPHPARPVVAAAVGVAAIVLTILTWSGFALSTRLIVSSDLSITDVALIRYLTPTLLLLPWWRHAWREIRATGPKAVSAVAIGGGVPFFLLTALGAEHSSATHVTVINAGATPVLAALFTVLLGGRRPDVTRAVGLAFIVAGVAVLSVATPGAGVGIVALLGSASLWAGYALGQGSARLSAVTVALLVSAPSALLCLVFAGPHLPSLLTAPTDQVAFFVGTQGIGSGLVSAVAFATAVARLGPPLATALGALTPVVVAGLSGRFLDEALPALAVAGIGCVVVGVMTSAFPVRSRQSLVIGRDQRAGGPELTADTDPTLRAQ